ncbi:hypothetical protein C8Q76DRAFT_624313 [Earliella scabrosa]|nr:hypothetical protein C8Q76DRAFT_624313 [Earliella scabrosa]
MSSLPSLLMPYRGSREAPTFNPEDPTTLERFFEDLERMFSRSKITDEAECIDYAVSYVPDSTWRLWKTIRSTSATYKVFKAAIFDLYPEADDTAIYTLKHYEQLVDDWARAPISSLNCYAAFYRELLPHFSFLLARCRIVSARCAEDILRVLDPAIQQRVLFRLAVRDPDHDPHEPWDHEEVNKAALYILADTSLDSLLRVSQPPAPQPLRSPPSPPPVSCPPSSPAPTHAVPQPLLPLEIIHRKPPLHVPQPRSLPTSTVEVLSLTSAPPACHYCGVQDCWIRDCPRVRSDIAAGLCRLRLDGRVVLPTGRFVPRDITGSCMRERVLAWHAEQTRDWGQSRY